jgi:hypothetical protein
LIGRARVEPLSSDGADSRLNIGIRTMDETLDLLQAWRDAESALREMTPETADWLRASVAVKDAREAYQDRVDALREPGAELAQDPHRSPPPSRARRGQALGPDWDESPRPGSRG